VYQLVYFLILLGLGYFTGRLLERRHLRSLRRREDELLRLPVITSRGFADETYADARLVTGCAVVSIDYFKRVWAALRNIFGGRIRAYESVLDRGRREAILRMKEQAARWGADIILNCRVETSSITNVQGRKKGIGGSEVLAYGTAVKRSEQGARP